MGRVNWARIFPFTCYPCGEFGYLIGGTIHGMAMKKPILILSLTVDYSDEIRFNLVKFFWDIRASSKDVIKSYELDL